MGVGEGEGEAEELDDAVGDGVGVAVSPDSRGAIGLPPAGNCDPPLAAHAASKAIPAKVKNAKPRGIVSGPQN